MSPGTRYVLDVEPRLPASLARMKDLASNLWYAWDRPTRKLFARLHPGLWEHVGSNPTAFLKRIDESRLAEAAEDPVFLSQFHRILSEYDTYHRTDVRRSALAEGLRDDDLIAYFCAEFGFHESFQIYSGGLGILAGDHCKSASDLQLPFVGVGLLYRQGYFFQTIDAEGNQQAEYHDSDFDDLPVEPVHKPDGSDLKVFVYLPGRTTAIKVWKARVGHVRLFLLDTDLEENTPEDRDIAHQLYGGDRVTRILQEIVLGIAGVRALKEMGLKPTVWHINEGHAAFLVLQRVRELVMDGMDFPAALETVAVSTVFTTHTPVPAGHDHFPESMVTEYLAPLLRDCKVDPETVLALGRTPGGHDFNMTALAIRGSRFHNGVSRIHGDVSSQICASLWPQVDPEDNPLSYVTNGVHVPTFLAQEWMDVFDRFLGQEWRMRLTDAAFWEKVHEIPDHVFWSVRQTLKSQLLYVVRARVSARHFRNHGSEAHLDRLLKLADPGDPNVLTIGFARRFATYKRAALLFHNLDWLREIVFGQGRPVLFMFAGKAHPADHPGQDLIRRIHQITRMPEFEGRVLLIEGYDLGLARRLLAGVDVWLNNPFYPLEASGTSGMKAGINGVINLSVLDGWWGEGYDGENGWAIKPAPPTMDEGRRNDEDAQTLYEILQDHVVPLYYQRGNMGFSAEWVKMAKRSIATLMPRYNSTRMVGEYVQRFYLPASVQGRRYGAEGHKMSHEVSAWKAKVRRAWGQLTMRRMDTPQRRIGFGESVRIEVAVNLDGLAPEDVTVELLVGRLSRHTGLRENQRVPLSAQAERLPGGEYLYSLQLTPELCGKLLYRIRAFPSHPALTQEFELGLMHWV